MITSGNRVLFTSGDFKGERGLILGTVPRRYRDEDIVYRIQIDDSADKTTTTDAVFDVIGMRNASGNKVRFKPRPYGVNRK